MGKTCYNLKSGLSFWLSESFQIQPRNLFRPMSSQRSTEGERWPRDPSWNKGTASPHHLHTSFLVNLNPLFYYSHDGWPQRRRVILSTCVARWKRTYHQCAGKELQNAAGGACKKQVISIKSARPITKMDEINRKTLGEKRPFLKSKLPHNNFSDGRVN